MSATTRFLSDVPKNGVPYRSDSHNNAPRSASSHDAARRSSQYPNPQQYNRDAHPNRCNGAPASSHVSQPRQSSQQSRPTNHHPVGGAPSTSAPNSGQSSKPKPHHSSGYRSSQDPTGNRHPDHHQSQASGGPGPVRVDRRNHPPVPLPYSRPQQPQNSHRDQQPQNSHRDQQPQNSHRDQQPQNSHRDQQPQNSHRDHQPQNYHREQQQQNYHRDQQQQNYHRDQQPQQHPRDQNQSSNLRNQPPQPSSGPRKPSVPVLSREKRAARNANMNVFKAAIDASGAVPCRTFELMRLEHAHYSRLMKIGQGTFGEVFKAKCLKTGSIVALKKILMENEKEGFPITALREINMLKNLRHPNVTELVDVCSSATKEKGKIVFFLVFAFCDHDLAGILAKSNLTISAVDAKTMLKQMFEGLAYVHGCEVLHRDMKTANILVSKDGYLKLADFGLARPKIKNAPCYTNRVVTMWYRPPELLLGERSYAGEVDVWGAGCIMAEFWTRSPIFQGQTEQHQLQLICNMCGSINEQTMVNARHYPLFRSIDPNFLRGNREVKPKLKSLIKSDSALDLIDRIFTLEPSMRPTASDALNHQYFLEEPLPRENVAEFMRSSAFSSGSLFEFTSKSGAHRRPTQHRPSRPAIPSIPRTQMFDRIF